MMDLTARFYRFLVAFLGVLLVASVAVGIVGGCLWVAAQFWDIGTPWGAAPPIILAVAICFGLGTAIFDRP